jgi:hypothetical protein
MQKHHLMHLADPPVFRHCDVLWGAVISHKRLNPGTQEPWTPKVAEISHEISHEDGLLHMNL